MDRNSFILELDNRQNNVNITHDIIKLIKECIATVLELENFPLEGAVSIILVDNPSIHQINLDYRNVDSPTDVLSFPILGIEPNDITVDSLTNDIDPDSGAVILGDIIISMEKLVKQAQDYDHSIQRELGFLVVHGMLHLLGYDHIVDQDREKMRAKEEAVLQSLKLERD